MAADKEHKKKEKKKEKKEKKEKKRKHEDDEKGATKKHKHKSSAAADGATAGDEVAPVQQQQQQQQQPQPQQHQQQLPSLPAAPKFDPLRDGDKTLQAFRVVRPPPQRLDQLRPCWPLEGAVATRKRPLAPMSRVLEGQAELWVVQLPGQMDADALDGCVLKIDEGFASHPERVGVMGQLEITQDAAADLELVRRYAVRQEGSAAREPLFIAAPTERAGGKLEVLRPARRLVVAEDVGVANEDLVERAHVEAPGLQFYPECMPLERANRLLQEQGRFHPPSQAGNGGGVPQWQALPGNDGGSVGGLLGDVEQDVSVSYRYA